MWPNYIEEIKDKKKKDQKKIDFCRKIGVYKRKENKKENLNSQKVKDRYIVENNELYIIKKKKKRIKMKKIKNPILII